MEGGYEFIVLDCPGILWYEKGVGEGNMSVNTSYKLHGTDYVIPRGYQRNINHKNKYKMLLTQNKESASSPDPI